MTNNGFASKDLTHGETNALVKLVGGEEMVRKLLRGQFVCTVEPKRVERWGEFTLPGGLSAKDFERPEGYAEWSTFEQRRMIEKIIFPLESETLTLAVVDRIDDLRVFASAMGAVFEGAKELGLHLCPQALAPAMVRAGVVLPRGDYLVASVPFESEMVVDRRPRKVLRLFRLSSSGEGGVTLSHTFGYPHTSEPPGTKYIFVKP